MRWIALLACALTAPAMAQTIIDDFSGYADGTAGVPNWDPYSTSFEVRDGALLGDHGLTVWASAPSAREMVLSCDVTVLEVTAREADWATAGIGIFLDEANYWGLHVVQRPQALGGGHFDEMQESLEGRWLAQSEGDTRLAATDAVGTDFAWQPGVTYRFEVQLRPERIVGRILEGEAERVRIGYDLTGGTPAVREGRPSLRANGLRAQFDNARVTVRQVAPDREEAPVYRPWESRPGDPVAKATGFFRVEEIDGRWWFIDPEGKRFFDVGTDHCNYNVHFCEKLGYAPYSRNVQAKFGSEEAWAVSATDRLKAWDFNTLAANHSPLTRYRGMPHILFASFGSGFAREEWICEPINWTGFPDVYSPRWEAYCRIVARRMASESKGDPWCIGIFLDNELEWYGKRGYLVDEVFQRPATQPAKRALLDWLLARYGSVAGIGRALGTDYADEQAFLDSTTVPEASEQLAAVRDGFLGVIAERYFGVAAEAMRTADPDHLVLGCRFAGQAPRPTLEAAGKHNDAFTINTYPMVDMEAGRVIGTPQMLCDIYDVVKLPMIITEWSFPALDSGLPCKHGAGMRVDTQEQKARCYQVFASMVADLPFMVGYHYFMWADEPAEGISSTFPEDSSYGLVNVDDDPYEVFVREAAAVNADAAVRHERSVQSGHITLELQDGGRVRLVNEGAMPAQGRLFVIGDSLEVRDVALDGGGSSTVRAPASCRSVIVRQWDGSLSEVSLPGPGGDVRERAVVNVGTQAVSDAPYVVDADPPSATVIPTVEPGQSVRVALESAAPVPLTSVALDQGGAAWTCDGQGGELFDAVAVGPLGLGGVVFATHQVIGGQHHWARADTVESITLHDGAGASILDFVVARENEGETVTSVDDQGRQETPRTVPGRFRAGVRVVVLKDRPIALIRPLWIENTDARAWQLQDAFVFLDPRIGGDGADDTEGGGGVPSYYLGPVGLWTDPNLGGAFGAVSRPDAWQVTFWTDEGGMRHPDSCFRVDESLEPRGRWTAAGAPYLWVFATADREAWRPLARLCRQAGQLR